MTGPNAAATSAPPARSWRLGVLLVLGLLVVAAVALAATSLVRTSDASAREDRREAVLAAARQAAVNFTTLDYRELDRDLGRVLRGSTGDFRKEFEAGTNDLSTLVTQNEAVSEGEVLEAGIVTDDADSARVLVVADATVTNSAEPEPLKKHYRMQLDLVRQGERWLVSDLQFVG